MPCGLRTEQLQIYDVFAVIVAIIAGEISGGCTCKNVIFWR